MRHRLWLLTTLLSLSLLLTASTVVFSQDHDVMHHSFHGAENWARVFEDPSRDAWQKPHEVVEALGLQPGLSVADIGAGTGYFSRHLARAVGDSGVVYAVDIEPDMLRYIQKHAKDDGQTNIVTVLAAPDNPMLPPGSVDLFLIVDTIHHIEDRTAYFRVLADDLRPGGRVAIVDFYKDKDIPVGPPERGRLSKQQLISEAGAANLVVGETFDFLPYQYFIVLHKK